MPIPDHFSRRNIILSFKDGTSERIRVEHRLPATTDDKFHTITQNETLTSIAWLHYRNPKAALVIADVNSIFDPFVLTVGATIRIPPKYTLDV